MRNLFLVILLGIMLFSLVGCNGSNDSDDGDGYVDGGVTERQYEDCLKQNSNSCQP